MLTPITPAALQAAPVASLLAHFADLPDPRRRPAECDHLLLDIITIAMLAVICGADEVTALATFGQARQAWLQTFLALPHSIPSHDTFERVLARLDPREFERCFRGWVARVAQLTDGEVVAIDGKTARRSHARGQGQPALAVVSAWARENRLTLGQCSGGFQRDCGSAGIITTAGRQRLSRARWMRSIRRRTRRQRFARAARIMSWR